MNSDHLPNYRSFDSSMISEQQKKWTTTIPFEVPTWMGKWEVVLWEAQLGS